MSLKHYDNLSGVSDPSSLLRQLVEQFSNPTDSAPHIFIEGLVMLWFEYMLSGMPGIIFRP